MHKALKLCSNKPQISVLAQTSPSSALAIQTDGTLQLTLNGQTHTLWPDVALQPIPPTRTGQAFWFDNGKLFISLPQLPDFAQGFVVK